MAAGATAYPSVPIPTATGSAASIAALAACYNDAADACATTGAFANAYLVVDSESSIASWMTWDDASQVLTLAPPAGTTANDGTYTLKG